MSNYNKKYFDVNSLKFINNQQNTNLIFPHEYLIGNKKINYKYIESIFVIFEYIFNNNHLIHSKNQFHSRTSS